MLAQNISRRLHDSAVNTSHDHQLPSEAFVVQSKEHSGEALPPACVWQVVNLTYPKPPSPNIRPPSRVLSPRPCAPGPFWASCGAAPCRLIKTHVFLLWNFVYIYFFLINGYASCLDNGQASKVFVPYKHSIVVPVVYWITNTSCCPRSEVDGEALPPSGSQWQSLGGN